MNIKELINDMVKQLSKEFSLKYSKEEIKQMKEPLNYFYNGSSDKYSALKKEYIGRHAIDYLDGFYNKENVSEEVKNDIFTWMYYSGCINNVCYKFTLFTEEKSLVPASLEDIKLFSHILYNKNIPLISNILKVSNNPKKIFSMMRNTLDYNFLYQRYLNDLLICYSKSNFDVDIYNCIFKDLCFKDSYGYEIYDFLSHDEIIITTNNVLDLIDNISKNGNEIVMLDKTYMKSRLFYDAVSKPTVKKVFDEDDMGCIEILKVLEHEMTTENKFKKI
ncbi:MAG: hypothetical protein PUD59_05880 [bacterium]|nr:hypothetical protein [bacterium]